MSPEQVPTPVKVGVTAAMAAATYVGSNAAKSITTRNGALVVGALATLAYVKWAFFHKKS